MLLWNQRSDRMAATLSRLERKSNNFVLSFHRESTGEAATANRERVIGSYFIRGITNMDASHHGLEDQIRHLLQQLPTRNGVEAKIRRLQIIQTRCGVNKK